MSKQAPRAVDPLTNAEMPMSEEAERNLIGSLIIDPEKIMEVDSILKDSGDFFMLSNRIMYTAMMRLRQRGDEVDPMTLVEELQNMGDFERIGGYSRIVAYTNEMVGTSAHATVYAELIARSAIRRRMIAAADNMRRYAFDESINIDELRYKADNEWMNATSEITRNKGEWISDVVSRVYDEIELAMTQQKTISGLSSGLRDVDAVTNGFGKGQFIVIAGRPGMGKSAAMDNIALHMARDCGLTILYATSERSTDEVVKRMAAIESGVNGMKIDSGRMTAQEASAFTQAIARIGSYSIKFLDDDQPRPRDIYAEASWMVKRHGCAAVLFDGMYRAKTGDPIADSKETTKYGTIALELKGIARKLEIPVITTHQLNRSLENRASKRPLMSDLRESGRIEEEADKIIFLYRDEIYNEATEFPNQCDWIIAKHRNGGTGTVATYYEKTNTRFKNATVHTVELNNI